MERLDQHLSLSDLVKRLNERKYQDQVEVRPQYLIIYQEHYGQNTWHHYLRTASLNTWFEIEEFRKSIPFCKLIADDILDILKRSAHNFPNDGAIRVLAHSLAEKLNTDAELRQEVSDRIGEFFVHKHVQPFAPKFLQAIVGSDEQIYLEKFTELRSAITAENSVDVLKGLELAAPTEKLYTETYLPLLDEQLATQNISRAEYLGLASTKQVNIQATHEFALEIARTLQSTNEGHAVLSYLDSFLTFADSTWFQDAAEAVFKYPDGELTHHLNNFVHELAEKNLQLVYTLMTKRFEAMGSKYFLDSAGSRMAGDGALFSRHLTQWFLSEVPAVHAAMRKLCSRHSIPDERYQLSEEILVTISASEKLFIAAKIAGYVYSKEPLQNLIISLTNSALKSESVLLENLHLMYDQYVIYNYRSTLGNIKTQIKRKDLPKHLRKFYTGLNDTYEAYFKQLQAIPNLMELSADFTITRYRDFYEQAMFQKLHAKTEKSDFLSLFKSVAVKSPRWGIRRPDQSVHEVQEMEHFETSTEFPMGERLNPIFQEKLRRHYQSLEKNEINID